MFLLWVDLLLFTNMWNKLFWLIIAGSPPRYKGDKDESFVYSPKNGEWYIFSPKRRCWSNRRGRLVEVRGNLYLLFINPKHSTIHGIYKSNNFYKVYKVYALIFENRFLVKFESQKYIYIYSCHGIASLLQEQTSIIYFMSHLISLLIADHIFGKKVL